MIFKDFNDYFNTLRVRVSEMCHDYDSITGYEIECDDLFQEASIKLFEIYTTCKPLDINYSLKAVKHRILNYIRDIERNSGK